MSTRRINSSFSSPTVSFYLDADVIDTDPPGTAGAAYGRWKIRAYLGMSKASGSHYGGSGTQYCLGNGSSKGSYSDSPFLPSSSTGWKSGPYDFWVNANSEGYWSGSSQTYPLGLRVDYGSIDHTANGSITLSRIAQKPNAPSLASPKGFTAITKNSAMLSFSDPDNNGSSIVERQIQVSRNAGYTDLLITTTSDGSTTVTGMTPVTDYWGRARVRNGVGWSDWSSSDTMKTLADSPSPPLNLAGETIGLGKTRLTWDPPGSNGGKPITGYDWEASRDNFSTIEKSGTATGSPTEITINSPGELYSIRVRAKNVDATGAWAMISMVIAAGARVWTGSQFKPAVVKVFTGTQWKVAKVWVCSDAGDPAAVPPVEPTWILAK